MSQAIVPENLTHTQDILKTFMQHCSGKPYNNFTMKAQVMFFLWLSISKLYMESSHISELLRVLQSNLNSEAVTYLNVCVYSEHVCTCFLEITSHVFKMGIIITMSDKDQWLQSLIQ